MWAARLPVRQRARSFAAASRGTPRVPSAAGAAGRESAEFASESSEEDLHEVGDRRRLARVLERTRHLVEDAAQADAHLLVADQDAERALAGVDLLGDRRDVGRDLL